MTGIFFGRDLPALDRQLESERRFRPELADTPRRPTQAAPAHGAHTEEVLREAGFGPEEIAALKAEGVVRAAPVDPSARPG